MPGNWRHLVWPVDNGIDDQRGRLNLAVPGLSADASMHLYARMSKRRPDVYSCGLVYTDPSGHDYRLVRCNGCHAEHANRLEGTKVPAVTPHVHYVSERYLRAM